jgi:hypothetical protein
VTSLPQRQVGACQVGGAAEQLRQQRAEGIERVLRGLARSDGLALLCAGSDPGVRLFLETGRQVASETALQFRRELRMRLFVGAEQRVPLRFQRLAPGAAVPGFVDVGGNLEGCVRPAQRLAGKCHLGIAQR